MTIKVGVMGTSKSDAFRGTDNRGGTFSSVTFNWLELLVRLRGFDAGTWGSYAEPRRTDYARNWSRSASHSGSLISGGQHTGLAAQLDSTTYVILAGGGNDIRPDDPGYERVSYGTIYNDATNPPTYYADPIVDDVLTAVDTCLAANPAGIMVWDYADLNSDPNIGASWPNATNRARVSAVWAEINNQLAVACASRGVFLAEYGKWSDDLISKYIQDSGSTTLDELFVWNKTITYGLNNDPQYFLIADTHFGTVANWLLASWVIESLNEHYGLGLRPGRPYEVFDVVGWTGRPTGSLVRT